MITGDFNCPRINWHELQCSTDRIHQMLFNFALECGLVQVVSFATMLQNVLDIVVIDEHQHIRNVADKPPLGHSDYDMVEFSIWLHRSGTKDNLSEENIRGICGVMLILMVRHVIYKGFTGIRCRQPDVSQDCLKH